MESQNGNPWELDDPPPRRNNQGVAGAYHVRENNELDHLDQSAWRIVDFEAPQQHSHTRSAIQPLIPQGQDIKISPQVIGLVQQNQYLGIDTEDPMDHIDLFEEICGTISSNEDLQYYTRCKLFSFSLGEKASKWLKHLPPASITTWDDCKKSFLKRFYP